MLETLTNPVFDFEAFEGFLSEIAALPAVNVQTDNKSDLFPEQWGAVLSDENPGIYRYALWRIWDKDLPLLPVCMLNPSKADHTVNDNTIVQLMTRARTLVLPAPVPVGPFGGLLAINVFAYRATDPADMKLATDPVGPHNEVVIGALLERTSTLLCAWGAHACYLNRDEELQCLMQKHGTLAFALRLTKHGKPCHPLRLAYGLKPVPFGLQQAIAG